MAIFFDNTPNSIQRIYSDYSFSIEEEGPFSGCFWAKLEVDRNDHGWAWGISSGSIGSKQLVGVYADGVTLTTWQADTASSVEGSELNVGEWYHIGLVRSNSTTFKVYLNGVLDITHAGDVGSTATLDYLTYASAVDQASEKWPGWLAHMKFWSAELTQSELQQEMTTIKPTRTANLEHCLHTFSGSGERTKDYSGNGNDFAETGILSDAPNPPVSWGAPSIFFPSAEAEDEKLPLGILQPKRDIPIRRLNL